ncbi:MAG TPA: TetR/AcrR family transcriptional regulator [Candidatus Binatia bacterium]|nr:TetR/AcrR family transcriptional regulator [Candidatus Binatia bacterium]
MDRSKRRRREGAITIPGPAAATQVSDKELWKEGRAKIAAAALPLFLRYGYHATPVRVIARAAGISSGSIFNYFSGKDEILELLLDESQAEAERALGEAQRTLSARGSDDPVARFVQVYRRYAESIDAIRRYTLLAYQEAKSLAPKNRTPLFERERRIADLLKAAAEPAIAAGAFSRDALDLKVQSLIALAHAWAVRHWAWSQYPTISAYLDDLSKLAVAMMKAQ